MDKEQAKSILRNVVNPDVKEAIETLIPELKENEDERIRKEIRNFLIDMECKEEWIAYFEKKKDHFRDDTKMVGQKSISTEKTELNSIAFLEQLGYTCVSPGAKQKPAEWGDEDEAALISILYCISQAIKNVNDENERNSLLNAKSWIQDKLKFHIPSRISHPRPSWKPSEEEVGCLERLIAFKNPEPEDINGCKSLLEQLTKLI